MSLIKNEKTAANTVELQFTVDHDTFETAVNKVYRKAVKTINVPGFRKGKAPRAIIEKMYGTGVFYEDAVNEVLPEAFEAAVTESGLELVGRPEFDIVSIDENGLVMKAIVTTKPEAKVEGYTGIEVARTVVPVSDEEVEREITTIRERNARELEITDRAAQLGDTVTIDYSGSVDGVKFEGGTAEGHKLKLGSGQFIPGFEEQIVGQSIGAEFDVNVSFPEEYHAEDLAGKAAVFACKLHAITATELPELDDEFAKDVSEFDTLAEYRADVVARIQKRHDTTAQNEVDEQLIEALIAKLECEIPEAMFVEETEREVQEYDNRLRMQGLDLKTYFQYTGMTLDSLREQMRPQAERQVKTRLALEAVAAAEGIEATEEEIEGEYADIAAAYGVELEQVKASIDASMIAADMKVKRAMDLVREKAVITDRAPEEKTEAAE